MFALKINSLSHKINKHDILKNINIELEKDKIACILGPSGCGKTTLLRLIAGLEKIKSGEILLNGNLVSSASNHIATEKKKSWFFISRLCIISSLDCKRESKLCY